MVEYYAYSIYHGQAAALGGRDRTHGLAVGAFKQSCTNDSHNEPAVPDAGRRGGVAAAASLLAQRGIGCCAVEWRTDLVVPWDVALRYHAR